MSFISRIRSGIQSTIEIAPHIYHLTIRGVNIILIIEEKLTLIDTGLHGSSTQIIDFIRHITYRIINPSMFDKNDRITVLHCRNK